MTINTTYTEMIEKHSCEGVSEVCRAQKRLDDHHPILFRVHHQVSEQQEGREEEEKGQ